MQIVKGGVTAAKGFLASGIHCGIKFIKKDLALIYSRVPSIASGMFTQNRVQAAPVKITQARLKPNKAQAIIINSGNANCCTGSPGLKDAKETTKIIAKLLNISPLHVLVASTGIIGKRLPIAKIEARAEELVRKLSVGGSAQAAEAILTTDTRPKHIAVKIKIGNKVVRIGAMAKGAGMISPHLATMLAFITTDIAIDRKGLMHALKVAVNESFNKITVEGDTSTNDMVLILANGMANNDKMQHKEFVRFQKALTYVCSSLAQMIIKDAEGATKFVEVSVEGAKNTKQADKVASRVANSALVKTALYGQNPNWGRIAACVGAAEGSVKQQKLNIYLGGIKVLHNGTAVGANQRALKKLFKKKEIQLNIDLGIGKSKQKIYTCDLSSKYVKINAQY